MNAWDTVESGIPRIPVGDWIDRGLDWIRESFGEFLSRVADVLETVVDGLAGVLDAPPALVMVAVLAGLAWLVRDWRLGATAAVGLVVVIGMDQWDNAMATLALVLVATLVALVIGVPLGIVAARWSPMSSAIRPVMDLMQTMPAFVWLVPFVFLFSIGVAPGVVATVVFALPPAVRLTELGIRQVDAEVVEAGHAFGATPRQILRGIQLPLALPTVMAGVNQVIMLALSMAVIAGLVGAGGLGSEVTSAIARLDVGLGFEAGLSVVILAIYLDRVTASVSDGGGTSRPRWSRLPRLFRLPGSRRPGSGRPDSRRSDSRRSDSGSPAEDAAAERAATPEPEAPREGADQAVR